MFRLPKRLLVGHPMRSSQLRETLLPKRLALPVYCSDPISSNAYATQEIMLVLALGGASMVLLTPWVALGRRRFSSLDLIAAASALEVVSGGRKRLVVAAWMVVPVLAATAFVLAAVGRRRPLGLVLVPLGPIYAVVALALVRAEPIRTLWGLWFAVAAGAAGSVAGVGLTWPRRPTSRRTRGERPRLQLPRRR